MDLPNRVDEIPDVPDERIVMSIIMTKEGKIKVQSVVLMDDTLCFGLLEKAKQEIIKHHEQIKSKIVKPSHGIMDFVRNGRK